MKKKRKPAGKPKARIENVVHPVASAEAPSRRRFMNLAINSTIAVPVVGGLGYYAVGLVRASISEADLTKIGNGRPAIVQIHDPNCSLCKRLQDQTRDALASYHEDSYEYLVANIKSHTGKNFAAKYGAPHVTLLLFNGKGEMVRVVRGPLTTPNLKGFLASHMAKYGTRS